MAGSSGFHRSQTCITQVAYIKNVDIDFSVIILWSLTVVVFLEVVFRYVFLIPQPYSGELSKLLHTTIIFIGLSRAEMKNTHVRIDFFKDKFVPTRFQSFLNVVFLFLKLFVAIIILIGSFQVVMKAGKMPSPAMGAPLLVFYIPNLVGFGLLTLAILWKIGTEFKIVGRNAIFNKNNGGH